MQKLLLNTITLLILAAPLLAWSHAGNNNLDAIHVCATKKQFRIVGATQACGKREKALHWNITGPQGNPGAPGTPAPVHAIGELYGGGIVFFVYDGGQHGLIAVPVDLGYGTQYLFPWWNGSLTVTNAVRDGTNAGGYNTERIVINQGAGSYAAQLCANYQGGGYGDWYLPSKAELILMYTNLHAIGLGSFANGVYWSSTVGLTSDAWSLDFTNGSQGVSSQNSMHRVRAVRAF